MWYSKDRKYAGSDDGISGVALAGNICHVNANRKIINIPIHHTGKLELIIAKLEVILSIFEPTLLLEKAPRNIPIIDMIMVAVVNNNTVLGSFSKRISFTSEDPSSLVRNVAFPKSNSIILYIVTPIL
jgi:hypothetical protein